MFEWLRDWWTGIRFWTDLVAKTAQAIKGVVKIFTDHFYQWWGAMVKWAASFFHMANALWWWAFSVVLSLEFVVYDLLPARERELVRAIVAYITVQIDREDIRVRGWVVAEGRRAMAEEAGLWRALAAWVTVLRQEIDDVRTELRPVKQRVVALLTHPEVLADWLAGAIGPAVWRWAFPRLAGFGGYLIRHAIPLTGQVALLIERIIADVFL